MRLEWLIKEAIRAKTQPSTGKLKGGDENGRTAVDNTTT